jgi:hypothetical protein
VPHFRLYESKYQNLKFAGKVIWYAVDKFVATIEGAEGLMLCDFVVDKDLIRALG